MQTNQNFARKTLLLSRAFLMSLPLLLVACDDGAEGAGEAVDDAVEDAGDAVEDAGDELEDAVDNDG